MINPMANGIHIGWMTYDPNRFIRNVAPIMGWYGKFYSRYDRPEFVNG